MQRYKQLEDLGVERENCYQNWMEGGEKEDHRYNEWLKQREEYGIDERDTWNWSDDFLDYVYIHLEMFNRVNIVDFDKETITFEGQTMTVQHAIDWLLNWYRTKYYPNKSDTIDINKYSDKGLWRQHLVEWLDEKHRMIRLFAEIIEHLNW